MLLQAAPRYGSSPPPAEFAAARSGESCDGRTDGQTVNRRTSHSRPLLHTYRVGGVVVLVDVCIHHLLGENVRSLERAALVASLHSLQ
jgi:hypothetical protein